MNVNVNVSMPVYFVGFIIELFININEEFFNLCGKVKDDCVAVVTSNVAGARSDSEISIVLLFVVYGLDVEVINPFTDLGKVP